MVKKHMGETHMEYTDLFTYLNKRCNFHYTKKNNPDSLTWTCHSDLRFTEEFCKKHNLDFVRVRHILEFFGGFCDCEVLMNVDREENEQMWEDRGTMILEELRRK